MIGDLPASVSSHIWDTLTRLNQDLQLEPSLAESWRLVNNFTWEVKLLQDITFHNGEPVNAEAVEFSIERSQSLPGSLETFVNDVNLERVEIVDDYTVRLITREPVANLPYYLAFLEIIPPRYYSETDSSQVAVAPVGCGPYQVKQWRPGEDLRLEAVSNYWRGPSMYPGLVFQTAPLVEERLAALRLGAATVVMDLPPLRIEEWAEPNSKMIAVESTQRMFVGMRIEPDAPLADKRVRQALNYGVDVKQITAELLEGYGQRYGSWVNAPWHNPDLSPWPYDPELARDLLAQAGYRQGFSATLQTPMDGYHQSGAIAKAIAGQLADIGITVEVETVSWDAYTHQLLDGEAGPLFLLALNSHADGLEDVKNLSAGFIFNPTGWQNPTFETLVGQAANTFNDNSRIRFLYEAQTIGYEEAPWIWLWNSYDFYGVNSALDWTPRRDGLVYLYLPLASSG
jgi:peptide/nickel transport system substrate-binding protein